ncbi:MAG: efflux RND transporter permease subunit [Planctomycetes bacterium]|nr:efflux RND transporter permease subunit [Planctomycetota bacterium]
MSASAPSAAKTSSIATRRPVGVTMVVFAVFVFGLVSLGELPQTLLPNISYPTLTVRTEFKGATPDDVDERVTARLQEELATVPNLVRISSISRAEMSDILLEFDWDTTMTFAVQDVTEKMNAVFLPQGADKPIILRYDPNLDPILRIGVSGSMGLRELREYAEDTLKEELEGIPGVAAARIRGGDEKEYRVHFRADELRRLGLDPTTLGALIGNANLNATGGLLREGDTEYLVRTQNEFQDAEDIRDLYLTLPAGGRIQVRDVAHVVVTDREREIVTRIDGKIAVELAIYREASANIVDTSRRVAQKVFGTDAQKAWVASHPEVRYDNGKVRSTKEDLSRDEKKTMLAMTDFLEFRKPEGVALTKLSDQSRFIEASVAEVRDSALIGGILAVVVLYLFLRRLSATVIIALSIPLSVIATFAPMYVSGVTLNVMSLGGLALGIGMLVDNSIVVLESITSLRDEGESHIRSIVLGTSQVGSAVIASTLTTIAVFFPIVFVEGVAGQIFGDQSVAVVSSLGVSLAVALFFIPVLATLRIPRLERPQHTSGPFAMLRRKTPRFVPQHAAPVFYLIPFAFQMVGRFFLLLLSAFVLVIVWLSHVVWWIARHLMLVLAIPFDQVFRALQRTYPTFLGWALQFRWVVLLGAALLMWFALERVPNLGTELLPEVHQGEFTLEFGMDVGTQLSRTDRIVQRIDRELRALPDVAFTVTVVGTEREELRRGEEGSHVARITVRMRDGDDLIEREKRLQQRALELLDSVPEIRSQPQVNRPTLFALSTPVEVEIRGREPETLKRLAGDVQVALDDVPGLREVRSSLRRGKPEIRVSFLREELVARGIEIDQATNAIAADYQGIEASQIDEGDRRVPVRLLAPEEARWGLSRLYELEIARGVPLNSIAKIDEVTGPAEIRRIGNRRAAVVSALPEQFDLGTVATRVENAILGIDVPAGYEIELGGQKREMERAQQSMQFALLLAVFLVYVVMASQFESLLQPFIILGSVPLALIGVVFTLEALAIPLSVIVFIGMIMLAGIVVNNAIVLIDRANQNRASGMPAREAVIEAGNKRLRPILMTTATTVLGLLPLTGWLPAIPWLGLTGEGAELRAPMAVTVISGLLASTVLTLYIIPVVYDLTARFARRRVEEDEADETFGLEDASTLAEPELP